MGVHLGVNTNMGHFEGLSPSRPAPAALLLARTSPMVFVTLALRCGFVLSWGPAGLLLWPHTMVIDPWPPIWLPGGPEASICSPHPPKWRHVGLPAWCLNPAKAEGMENSCAG